MKWIIKLKVEKFERHIIALNLSRSTYVTYCNHLKHFSVWLWSNHIYSLLQIRDWVIEKYIADLLLNRVKPVSINNKLKLIKTFLKFYNHSINVKPLKYDEIIKPSFSIEDMRKIMENTQKENSASVLCTFLLSTGVRSRSVRNIKVEDINFENKTINVKITKSRKLLIIPLIDALEKLLIEYIQFYNLKDSDFLFFNTKGKELHRTTIYELIKRYLKSIGVEKKGVHIFRHSFAKACCLNNCNAVVLQRLMGHAKIEETQKYIDLYCNELYVESMHVNPLENKEFLKNS